MSDEYSRMQEMVMGDLLHIDYSRVLSGGTVDFNMEVDQKVSGHKIMRDKELFLEILNEIIEERKKTVMSFYDIESDKEMLAEEYYGNILLEMKRLADKIFSDEDFIKEQFSHYNNFHDYINDIIKDIVKEDSMGRLSFTF